mgnify:FL=1
MLNEICESCFNRVGYENLNIKDLKYLCSDCFKASININKIEKINYETCQRCDKVDNVEMMYQTPSYFLCEICSYDMGLITNGEIPM